MYRNFYEDWISTLNKLCQMKNCTHFLTINGKFLAHNSYPNCKKQKKWHLISEFLLLRIINISMRNYKSKVFEKQWKIHVKFNIIHKLYTSTLKIIFYYRSWFISWCQKISRKNFTLLYTYQQNTNKIYIVQNPIHPKFLKHYRFT